MTKLSSTSFVSSRANDKEITSLKADIKASLLKNDSLVLDHDYNISCAIKEAKSSERQYFATLLKKEKSDCISSAHKNETKMSTVLLDLIVSVFSCFIVC